MGALVRASTERWMWLAHSAGRFFDQVFGCPMSDPVVKVEGLRKSYGSLVAVDGISFNVAQGEILGLIGPNGAGKTTVVECILGLRKRDGGTIRVLGEDPGNGGRALKNRVGAQLQAAALQDRLKV